MANETKVNPMDEIMKTVGEIREVLAKSGHLAKADDEQPSEQKPEEAPAPEASAPSEAPAPEAPAPEAPAPEAPAPEAEGQPSEAPAGGWDEQFEAEMAQHVQEMPDHELDKMLELLMTEKESRSAQGGEGGGEQPSPEQPQPEQPQPEVPAPEAPAPEGPSEPEKEPEEPAEKSAKDDLMKLSKSLDIVIEQMAKIDQKVTNIEGQGAAPAATQTAQAKKPTMVSKPATTSRPQVQVLEKSGKPAETSKVERLNKSESIEFLIGEMRKGNPLVNSGLISDFNYAQSQDDVNSLQDRETRRGVQFPKL